MSHKLLPPAPIRYIAPSKSQLREASDEVSASKTSRHSPTGLDLSQRLERKLAQYNGSPSVIKRWLFEIISWSVSAACMGAIIGILAHSKDQPLTQRPLALSINNVLSKIASATLILPISEAIGQLKWNWFQGSTSKEMVDFEIFDKASRGAWGSFLLLFRTKGRSLAAFGAVLTLLMLATDTFFQQVSELSEHWITQGHGDIPRVIQYVSDIQYTYQDGLPLESDELNLRRVTLQYFYYNGTRPVAFGNGTRPDIPLSCPSNRCEWDAYETLGVCSSCSDISDLLTYACLEAKLDWLSNLKGKDDTFPNGTSCGFWLNATSSDPILMSGFSVNQTSNITVGGEALLLRTLPLNAPVSLSSRLSGQVFGGSIHYKDIYAPILDALIVSSADGTAESVYKRKPPIAQECILSWCVKLLKSSYISGNYEETVIATYFNNTGRTNPTPWSTTEVVVDGQPANWVTFGGDYIIRPPSSNLGSADYGLSNETFSRTQGSFDEIFPSTITAANRTAQPWWRIRVAWWGSNYLRAFTYNPWLAPNNLTSYMEDFASAMTNSLRSQKSVDYLSGRAYRQTTFIVVHWEWLTFPLALLFLSLAFLIATIFKNRKEAYGDVGIWKTSTMPTLIYSLPKEVQQGLCQPSERSSSKAKKVRIRITSRQGWRVSGQTITSPTLSSRANHRPPPGWI